MEMDFRRRSPKHQAGKKYINSRLRENHGSNRMSYRRSNLINLNCMEIFSEGRMSAYKKFLLTGVQQGDEKAVDQG